jgi:hypothetical protein
LRATCFTTQRSASSECTVPSTAKRMRRPLVEGADSGAVGAGASILDMLPNGRVDAAAPMEPL